MKTGHHGNSRQNCKQGRRYLWQEPGSKDQDQKAHHSYQYRLKINGSYISDVCHELIHGLDQRFLGYNGQSAKILDLADQKGHGNSCRKSCCDRIRNKFDQAAHSKKAHHDQDHSCHDRGYCQPFHSLIRNDSRHDSGKGCCRACDLDSASSQKRNQEACHDRRINSPLRRNPAGQRKRYRQRKCYDRNNDS